MRLKDALAKFQTELDELFASGRVEAYLDFCSRFRNYSFHNAMLIMAQCPEATRVAGYKQWQKLGRQVQKGEKAIKILAPLAKKVTEEDENGNETEVRRVVGFRPVSVFDVSQTEGEELPEAPISELASAELADVLPALVEIAPVPVDFGEPGGGAHGRYNGHAIVVDKSMSDDMRAKTLVHEIAHAWNEDLANGTDRQRAEVIAESTAYLVTSWLGLDTASYSVGYVALWGQDRDEILASGQAALKTARAITDKLEAAMS